MKPILNAILLIATAISAFATPAAASPIFQHQITIIGENHHHADSTEWFLSTISNYVQNGKCLNVALEIGSSQQSVLNAAMKGNAQVSLIRINSIIDHPAYRQMLTGFRNLAMGGSCLHVYAIDTPQSAQINRDEWMAEQISSIGKEATIIALLGNLHALKHVDWYQEARDEPFLAERLQSMDMDVFSVIQNWPLDNCTTRHAKLIAADTSEGREALKHVLEPVAANLPKKPEMAIDMALVWKCQ